MPYNLEELKQYLKEEWTQTQMTFKVTEKIIISKFCADKAGYTIYWRTGSFSHYFYILTHVVLVK